MPELSNLRVLSMSYNQLGNEKSTMVALASKCPNLEHLNLMKNPCNPVFTSETNYHLFRARFSIWLTNLKTLDGTNFSEDQALIKEIKSSELSKKQSLIKGVLESIAEVEETK